MNSTIKKVSMMVFLSLFLLCSCGKTGTVEETNKEEKMSEGESLENMVSEAEASETVTSETLASVQTQTEESGDVFEEDTSAQNIEELPEGAIYALKKESYFEYGSHKPGESELDVCYEYENDAMGRAISRVAHYTSLHYSQPHDGNRYEYVYDENGRLAQTTERNSDGDVSTYYKHEYDEAGNLTKSFCYAMDWIYYGWIDYEYNENNDLIKKFSYYIQEDGSAEMTGNTIYDYVYDENNRKLQMKCGNEDGSLEYWEIVSYEYDEDGYLIRSISNSSYLPISEFIYDEAHNLIRENLYSSLNGKLIKFITYEYEVVIPEKNN